MRYRSKIATFNLHHFYLAPPLGVNPLEFRQDLWYQKTRVNGLSNGVVCLILRLAILVQCRFVTDRQTDMRTHEDSIYRASIASHRKNEAQNLYCSSCSNLQPLLFNAAKATMNKLFMLSTMSCDQYCSTIHKAIHELLQPQSTPVSISIQLDLGHR